jgi:hypothetical protein
MKRIKNISAKLAVLLIALLFTTKLNAQLPGAPALPLDDPSLNGKNGAIGHPTGPLNGGANIDGGMNIFLLFALAYGTHRYYRAKRKEKELAENAIE